VRSVSSQGFLQLTPTQRADLVQLRGVCLAKLSTIIEQRNNIHAFLTVPLCARP
jgi:hypothetical protein